MPGLIAESPVLSWPALQAQTVRVACTLRAGLTTADYGTLTLTVREDPEYPRTGATKVEADGADPLGDGWSTVASATGAWDVGSPSTALFTVTVPSGAGYRRYALDVVADGGAAGRVELVPATWLNVNPTLK